MKSWPTADELFQILDDNGIDYVISERMEGVMYLMFTLDDTLTLAQRMTGRLDCVAILTNTVLLVSPLV
jgi:hypothetical protein